MSDFSAMNISASGMTAQRLRMKVIAENLANQQTTGPDGPYQRKECIFNSQPVESFDDMLQLELEDGDPALSTVAVTRVREDGNPPMRRYDPSHPYAGEDGYVEFPNISIFREMTDLVEASRSYEANLAALKASQDMMTASLEIIRK